MAEFKLYYDDNGKVICYNNDKSILPYKYIIVSAQVYAEGRTDLLIKNNEIIRQENIVIISKLMQSKTGITCSKENILILASEGKQWSMEVKEYVNN